MRRVQIGEALGPPLDLPEQKSMQSRGYVWISFYVLAQLVVLSQWSYAVYARDRVLGSDLYLR